MCHLRIVAVVLSLSAIDPADSMTLRLSAMQDETRTAAPTIDELLSLRRAAGATEISPDGTQVAFVIRETNWEENTFETEIWLAEIRGGTVRQLTNGPRSSSLPAWSPDGTTIAFVSDRSGRRQIYTIDARGGEARQLTSWPEPVNAFEWSPDGTTIAFTATDPISETLKTRSTRLGDFEDVDQDHRMTHLHVIDVTSKRTRRITQGSFVVGSFNWAPNGAAIAFDHRINSDPDNDGTSDISVVNLQNGAITPVVVQPGPDTDPRWSPDSSELVFVSAMGNSTYMYANRRLAIVPSAGGVVRNLTSNFDESPSLVAWKPSGIFFMAMQRTASYLFTVEPGTTRVTRLAPSEGANGAGFSLSADGQMAALVVSDPASLPEVAVVDLKSAQGRRLTNLGAQVKQWRQPTREVVTWKSKDGTLIEGVLHKPDNVAADRRPLLVVIHGGPIGVARPTPFNTGGAGSSAAYPIELWLARGALVLEPNYRGSGGYGETFRSLNVRNLGIGDAWDVISGVEHLVQLGMVDSSRVGVMGWSQGGFIAAFLATHDSTRFRAVSVGAGISDWTLYYTATDIHRFTRQYLGATPWADPDIYARTSPLTYIRSARAPTLIQHGATDQRVPLANAYALYQGIQDSGAPARLMVYRGFDGLGHVPTRPKSGRALMEHNLEWFDKYLFEPASDARAR